MGACRIAGTPPRPAHAHRCERVHATARHRFTGKGTTFVLVGGSKPKAGPRGSVPAQELLRRGHVTITITHPGARLLAPALDTLADVVAGDWTSAARLCAARLQDPVACARDLDAAAARAGVIPSQRQPYRYRVHHRMLIIDECSVLLAAALDLQIKLWMGQWDALEQVAPSSAKPADGWRSRELLEARIRHQRARHLVRPTVRVPEPLPGAADSTAGAPRPDSARRRLLAPSL